jgi:hypothetical protein
MLGGRKKRQMAMDINELHSEVRGMQELPAQVRYLKWLPERQYFVATYTLECSFMANKINRDLGIFS